VELEAAAMHTISTTKLLLANLSFLTVVFIVFYSFGSQIFGSKPCICSCTCPYETVPSSEPQSLIAEDKYAKDTFFDSWFATRKTGSLADKWIPYFKTYDRHFGRYRGKEAVLLEIGVQSGGSSYMWPDYFGKNLRYHGLDININCKQFERLPQVTIHIVDQSRETQLREVLSRIPAPDMILDDGGHSMVQQLTTFRALWPVLKKGGVYCCEDTHTSYWSNHGGGFGKKGSFVEFVKTLNDVLHKNHWPEAHNLTEEGIADADGYFNTIRTITAANSIYCFEKGDVIPFDRVKSGDFTIPY